MRKEQDLTSHIINQHAQARIFRQILHDMPHTPLAELADYQLERQVIKETAALITVDNRGSRDEYNVFLAKQPYCCVQEDDHSTVYQDWTPYLAGRRLEENLIRAYVTMCADGSFHLQTADQGLGEILAHDIPALTDLWQIYQISSLNYRWWVADSLITTPPAIPEEAAAQTEKAQLAAHQRAVIQAYHLTEPADLARFQQTGELPGNHYHRPHDGD